MKNTNTLGLRCNSNIVVIGKAGSGKTRGMVIPNIMEETASYIINDPCGDIYGACGETLKNDGYNVIKVDALEADTLDASDFDAASIGSTKTAVFIIGQCFFDEEKRARKAKLYADLFTVLVDYANTQNNGQLNMPVMFVLDDFYSIGRIPDFWKANAMSKDYGISYLVTAQCFSQIDDTYPDRYKSIYSNSDTVLLHEYEH